MKRWPLGSTRSLSHTRVENHKPCGETHNMRLPLFLYFLTQYLYIACHSTLPRSGIRPLFHWKTLPLSPEEEWSV
jgi:hypothetical protein